ncbi:hypothetical protein MKW94_001014 [Papaver nudicaule]|uniref:Uncharacterized protein n=1 Tax=Papaver nudicaule TaxID=74823 RepID=A0AA41SGX1_PAPNU|nr:hypothetical protein [Papaver nudicaule]
MDAKSLARSKRAHTQHHQNKKPHPNQKLKAPAIVPTEGNKKNPSGKPKSSQSQGSSGLPSNWDRYEDEFEQGSELSSTQISGIAGGDDVVKLKSKGADFSYLVSEAQSQSSSSLDCFNSFYDALPDFDKAISSMLSVRGKSVLAWTDDDNFIVDDNASSGYEAPSLSMDLHALAAQLEKIDIPRRLLIEADLLPPELCAGGLDDHISQEFEQVQLCISRNNDGYIDVDESTSHNTEAMPPLTTVSRSSSSTNDDNLVPVFHSKGMELLNPGVDDLQMLDSDLSATLDSMKKAKFCPVPCSEDKAIKFEAAAAEAELDTLLDSLGEIDILSSTSSISNFPVANQVNSTFIGGFAAGNSNAQPTSGLGSRSGIGRVPMNIDIDDTVDDLLSGPRNMNPENSVLLPRQEVPSVVLPSAAPFNSSSSSHSSSKLLDDFDSWLDTI